MPKSFLRERVVAVVNAVFAGNVNAAAEAADIPVSTLHWIVEGKVDNPRLDTITHLARVYGVPLVWLLGETDTESAQGMSPSIPESFWLIIAYHAARQRPIREKLEALELASAEAKRLRSSFLKLDLIPFSEKPAVPSLDLLLTRIDPRSSADVRFVGKWAEFSSLALEAVFDKVRQLEAGK